MNCTQIVSVQHLAVIALVARHLFPNVVDVLVVIARANVDAYLRAFPFAAEMAPATAEEIEAAMPCVGAEIAAQNAERAWDEFRTLRANLEAGGRSCLPGEAREQVQFLGEALGRIERAARTAPAGASREDIWRGHWTGPKYVSSRDAAEVAKDVRKDLVAASKADAGALRGVTCRVRKGGFASLEIEVVAVPAWCVVLNGRRIEAELTRQPEHSHSWLSSRGRAIEEAIRKVVAVYSWDRGVQDQAIHVSVNFAAEILKAQRAEIETAARKAGLTTVSA